MRKGIIGIVGIALIFAVACSNNEKKARKLYVEASEFVTKALEAEEPADKLVLYKEALAKLEQILERYPETEVARDLVNCDLTIGGITLYSLKYQEIPQMAKLAEIFNEISELKSDVNRTEEEMSEIGNEIEKALEQKSE